MPSGCLTLRAVPQGLLVAQAASVVSLSMAAFPLAVWLALADVLQ
jgi:hypothetical protein